MSQRPFERIGVVGAGIMGTAITAAHVGRLLPTVMIDTCATVLGRARTAITEHLASEGPGCQAGRLVSHLLGASQHTNALRGCDLIIESIPEVSAVKRRLYAQLQRDTGEDSVLATNTSTIPIRRLAEGLAAPARFCGLHFCHPVAIRPLVEIVRGEATSDETLARVVAHVRTLGRMPIVVDDGPGFAVNRLLGAYLIEALTLVLQGVVPEQLDQQMIDFGMSMGPLEQLDEIGLDTILQSGMNLWGSAVDRPLGSSLLVGMVKAGHLGRKTGRGFYLYPERTLNPALGPIVAQWREAPGNRRRSPIELQLLAPMILEAARILAEGKVSDPGDIDLATIFGLGFPPFRGGLLWWADAIGAAEIRES